MRLQTKRKPTILTRSTSEFQQDKGAGRFEGKRNSSQAVNYGVGYCDIERTWRSKGDYRASPGRDRHLGQSLPCDSASVSGFSPSESILFSNERLVPGSVSGKRVFAACLCTSLSQFLFQQVFNDITGGAAGQEQATFIGITFGPVASPPEGIQSTRRPPATLIDPTSKASAVVLAPKLRPVAPRRNLWLGLHEKRGQCMEICASIRMVGHCSTVLPYY